MLEKGGFINLLAMILLMAGSFSGCAVQQNNLRKDLFSQEMSGAELERSGDVYFNQGNLQLALLEYEKCLKLNPDSNRVRYKKGRIFLKGETDEAAIREFKKIIDNDPGHALATQGLGQAFFRLENYEDAVKYYRLAEIK